MPNHLGDAISQVKAYYESPETLRHFFDPHYFDRLVWHTQFEFTDPADSRRTNETDYLIKLARVEPNHRVLDFGCGVGNLCFKIAREKGCAVVGLNIAERQIGLAEEECRKLTLEKLVRFIGYDGVTLPFPSASFDTVLFQESVCHVPDKPAIFREFYRVLKPGGCLAGQDWLAVKPDSELIGRINQKFCAFLATLDAYEIMADSAGFVKLRRSDAADWPDSSHRIKFGGPFREAVDGGVFTIGFLFGQKPADGAGRTRCQRGDATV
jgi:SAM-dependent methyltransferase